MPLRNTALAQLIVSQLVKITVLIDPVLVFVSPAVNVSMGWSDVKMVSALKSKSAVSYPIKKILSTTEQYSLYNNKFPFSAQPTCSGDEVFDACSAHCEPTCENNGPNRACAAVCRPGCKCGDGLVRRKDGKCVKLKDCSKCHVSTTSYINIFLSNCI